MNIEEISPAWLKAQKFVLHDIATSKIEGVVCKSLTPIEDDRGDLVELWSMGWLDTADFIPPVHCYQTATKFGVIKGWHLHNIHTDQISCTRGKMQIVLIDLRPQSSTFGHINSIICGIENQILLKIPVGVLHAFKALSAPEVIITNFQSHTYDSKDELNFPLDSISQNVWKKTPAQ